MMPVYNGEAYINEAVVSVQNQTYPNWELVIVDDGSTDATSEILSGYQDPRIRVFHQDNQGEAAARNHALDVMQGEYLAFLDADDRFRPDHLAVTLTFLEEHPECLGVYTDGEYIDQTGVSIQSLSSQRRGPFTGDLFEPLVRASDVFGPPICLLLRTTLIHEHGLRFDVRITIGPDWDFTTRFAETATFGFLPEKSVYYRVHGTNITSRVDGTTRQLSLAQCRENAIKRPRFSECSLGVRSFVFYELLVDLLRGYPERQDQTASWPEFLALPPKERSRIFRLMASAAVRSGNDAAQISKWMEQARHLDPGSARNTVLERLYHLSPRLCRALLNLRSHTLLRERSGSPFGLLK
jgi:glycosyltransferase involved in cell wall biosynthesis